jgi:hypothetical protein
MFQVSINQEFLSKKSNKVIKVLGVVKSEDGIARNNLVMVCDTRQDSLGRTYRLPDTSRLVRQGSIERKYQ